MYSWIHTTCESVLILILKRNKAAYAFLPFIRRTQMSTAWSQSRFVTHKSLWEIKMSGRYEGKHCSFDIPSFKFWTSLFPKSENLKFLGIHSDHIITRTTRLQYRNSGIIPIRIDFKIDKRLAESIFRISWYGNFNLSPISRLLS